MVNNRELTQDELDMFNFCATRELSDLEKRIERAEMRHKFILVEMIAFSFLVVVAIVVTIKCLL